MSDLNLKNIVEAALHAANRPLSVDNIANLFAESERPDRSAIRETIAELQNDYDDRGVELVEVASGFRVQVRTGLGEWISRLWQERPPRYSRALLETLSIVAYRQPVTRGEIEEIRGVSVSSTIMRTLLDRGWLRVVGHRDVPGKPALFATTREFLNYFGLKRLEDLPPLAELKDLDSLNVELELGFEESGILSSDIVEPADIESDQIAPEQADRDDRRGGGEDEEEQIRTSEATESQPVDDAPAAALSGEAAHGLSNNELPEAEESDAAATDQKETADVRPRGDLDSVAEVSNEIAPDADSAWSNNGVVDQTESRNDNVVPLAKNTVDE
jgi:segregation and condensation protein B